MKLCITHRLAILALAGLFVLGCGGSAGSISGKVVVDGVPAAGVQLLLQGRGTMLTSQSGADGAYQFKDLSEGTYVLSTDVASTREGHQEVVVAVKGASPLPDLTFQGLAPLDGKVVGSDGHGVPDAKVVLLGNPLEATTDAAGHFSFPDAPTGSQTVSVSAAAGSGQTAVELERGVAQTVTVTLVAAPPGTVQGQALFSNYTDLSVIQISAPAAGVTTQATVDGNYALELPAGDWDLYAQAPYYPLQKIGRATVRSGETAVVAPYQLSLYQPLPTLGTAATFWSLDGAQHYGHRSAALLTLNSLSGPSAYYAFDLATQGLRFVSLDVVPLLSADGTYAVVPLSSTTVRILSLTTGTSFVVNVAGTVDLDDSAFSFDGSVVFLYSPGAPGTLYRVTLADQTVTSYPSYSTPKNLFGDRFLLQTTNVAPINWTLVTPSTATVAFENVPSVNAVEGFAIVRPSVIGTEACASAPCSVYLLKPTDTQAAAIPGVLATGVPSVNTSEGRWLVVQTTPAVLVDTATGDMTTMPATVDTGSIQVNLPGSRVTFTENAGSMLFESALPLPDPSTLTPLLTSTGGLHGTWAGSTRFIGFDDTPTSGSAYRFSVEAGTLSKDTDYQPGSGTSVSGGLFPFSSGVEWATSSDGLYRVAAGNAQVMAAPPGVTTGAVGATPQINFVGTYPDITLELGTQAAVWWDTSTLWFLDGTDVRSVTGLSLSGFASFIGPTMMVSSGPVPEIIDASTGQRIGIFESGLQFTGLDISLGDFNSLVVGYRAGPVGQPTGGAFALLPLLIVP